MDHIGIDVHKKESCGIGLLGGQCLSMTDSLLSKLAAENGCAP